MGDFIKENFNADGVDRRGFLKCMAWAGTGTFCLVQGGVLKSFALSQMDKMDASKMKGELAFVQISDSHIGFNKPANPDVTATLQAAIDKINARSVRPEFVLHTGDLSHLSKDTEFDTLDQALKSIRTGAVHYVPGEHDVLNDNGAQYRERYGNGTKGDGWYSFDQKGVHFVGLVNVMNLKSGGLGTLGHDQLEVEHADCGVRAHSAVVRVPRVGLGDGGQRAGARVSEEVRVSKRAERAHPSGDAEGGGQRHVPHGDVHCVSPARARDGAVAGADESASRAIAHAAGRHGRQLRSRQKYAGDRGFGAAVVGAARRECNALRG
jgi:hypothetical protein